QAQVVVDLGYGADGRAGVAAGGLLIDGDGRRQPLDVVHVGLVHLAEELAGVGAQALDVAPLTFRVEGVEGERGLAGPGETGDHHELIAGYLQVDVLEVVLTRALDEDSVVLRHSLAPSRPVVCVAIKAHRILPSGRSEN